MCIDVRKCVYLFSFKKEKEGTEQVRKRGERDKGSTKERRK